MNVAKRGRKRKLTEADKKTILDAVSDGLSRKKAAILVGVTHQTIAYLAGVDAEFSTSLRKAEVDCELHHIRRIKSGERQWQSSAWFLERKHYREWSIKSDGSNAGASQFCTPDPTLAQASLPPGAVPGVEQPGEVQDDSRGTPERKDGDIREA